MGHTSMCTTNARHISLPSPHIRDRFGFYADIQISVGPVHTSHRNNELPSQRFTSHQACQPSAPNKGIFFQSQMVTHEYESCRVAYCRVGRRLWSTYSQHLFPSPTVRVGHRFLFRSVRSVLFRS